MTQKSAVPCCRTDIVPTFKQLSSLQVIGNFMPFSDHYITLQSAKLISSCFDLRNILLSNQTNVTWLLIRTLLYVYYKWSYIGFRNEIKIGGHRLRFRDMTCGKLVVFDKMVRAIQHGLQGLQVQMKITNSNSNSFSFNFAMLQVILNSKREYNTY